MCDFTKNEAVPNWKLMDPSVFKMEVHSVEGFDEPEESVIPIPNQYERVLDRPYKKIIQVAHELDEKDKASRIKTISKKSSNEHKSSYHHESSNNHESSDLSANASCSCRLI